jgi:solute carrier family 25 carnitine/acylcarnitine transporter 20/29
MIKENIKYYINGSLIGIGQVMVGHPFDTMKVYVQKNNTIKNYKFINSFSGIKYPILLSTFSNAGLFGIYSTFYKNGFSHFESGFYSGLTMSVIMNPFEFWKIQAQSNQINYNINKKKPFLEKVKLSYSGMIYMTPREALGNGIYFNTYFNLRKFGIEPFIAGGLAGTTSWILTYAIDTMKTRKQANPNWTFKECYNAGPLYRGIIFCLLRAFLANGFSFVIYDYLNR